MYTGMLHTHRLVVALFLLIYLVKTILLFLNKHEALTTFIKKTKVAEMIISVLFLATGIYLASNSGNTGTWLWVKLVVIAISIPIAIIAFKGQKKSLALISLLLIIYAYGISETKSPTFKKPVKEIIVSDNKIEVGQNIYGSYCANCHGADGKLGMSGAKDLSITVLSQDEKINVITQGKNAMMSFGQSLSKEQIQDVADYIETLKTK